MYICIMQKGKIILDKLRFETTLLRLSHQLHENYDDFQNTCIIGIQEKGVLLGNRLVKLLDKVSPNHQLKNGTLDITFYRDDFRLRSEPIKASETDIPFNLDGMKVILADDVLYSGRTIHAAMSAIQDFGRPSTIELLVMVDRRFNRHLPIQADYTGLTVDALDEAYVRVRWEEIDKKDQVIFYPGQNSK